MAKQAPLAAILHQLKLGMEVVAPDISSDYSKKTELRLQREIARFLVERGVYATGTQFGQYQADFAVGTHDEHYVIEVKKYAKGRRITEKAIKSAIVQLQSYMDQPPTHPLGILVIFNFTDSLLIAPSSWIRGRFKILAINLQLTPPSGRTQSLTVEEGSEQSTIAVHIIDGPAAARKTPGPQRAKVKLKRLQRSTKQGKR
jgi:hypothetical protein